MTQVWWSDNQGTDNRGRTVTGILALDFLSSPCDRYYFFLVKSCTNDERMRQSELIKLLKRLIFLSTELSKRSILCCFGRLYIKAFVNQRNSF